MTCRRVLVMDDERDMLENCRRLLEFGGLEVETLADSAGFMASVAAFHPDVLLLDLRMPQVDGMTVLAEAVAADPQLPVIIMTAYGTLPSAVSAFRAGAFDFLTKPFSAEQLEVAVSRALRYRSLAVENRALRQQIDDSRNRSQMVGHSEVLLKALAELQQVAPTEANVLLLGESGTGKELFARRLHELSPRVKGPFVPIDCAAMPENLLETELFGHEKGAFTGAVGRKEGLFVAASGGTVLLDEIGDLGLGLQGKLLRALEERQIRPVGATRLVPIDVRILAATNADLESAVEAGRFRADLFFRLNVIQVPIPPLRARTGDVPLLLAHFLREFSTGTGRPAPAVAPDALDCLERYRWPGNVRELRNLAQRLVIMDTDGVIALAQLPRKVRDQSEEGEVPTDAPPLYEEARKKAMGDFLHEYTRGLLDYHAGNVSRAAAAAGVNRRTFYRWLAGAADEPGP